MKTTPVERPSGYDDENQESPLQIVGFLLFVAVMIFMERLCKIIKTPFVFISAVVRRNFLKGV